MRKQLPDDICRCSNADCELKLSCLRYSGKSSGEYIPFSDFKPANGRCEYKIEN